MDIHPRILTYEIWNVRMTVKVKLSVAKNLVQLCNLQARMIPV